MSYTLPESVLLRGEQARAVGPVLHTSTKSVLLASTVNPIDQGRPFPISVIHMFRTSKQVLQWNQRNERSVTSVQ